MTILLESLGLDPRDPEVVAEQQDFSVYADLIAQLVARRKRLGLSQQDVASVMGTGQSAVSAIETSSANPTIQRLQRYARALGARLELGVEIQNDGSAAAHAHGEAPPVKRTAA